MCREGWWEKCRYRGEQVAWCEGIMCPREGMGREYDMQLSEGERYLCTYEGDIGWLI